MADPDLGTYLGFKPLLAKLREQQPDLGAATKEVREALAALKVELVPCLPPKLVRHGRNCRPTARRVLTQRGHSEPAHRKGTF